MASTANGTPAAFDDREPKGHVVRDGHLPVTELLSDRPGANSVLETAYPRHPARLSRLAHVRRRRMSTAAEFVHRGRFGPGQTSPPRESVPAWLG